MNTIEPHLPEQLLQNSTATAPEKRGELGQNEFLSLMLAQLEHQDPFKPLENSEFVAQMAQFSTVAGIEGMDTSMQAMSESLAGNQLMQASSLIGRTALVPGSTTALNDDSGIQGLFELAESATSTALNIFNSAGELVYQEETGFKQAGAHPFGWNGLLDNGNRAPAGQYTVSLTYGQGENLTQANTLLENRISTISLARGDNTVTIETEEGNLVSLLDIQQIK